MASSQHRRPHAVAVPSLWLESSAMVPMMPLFEEEIDEGQRNSLLKLWRDAGWLTFTAFPAHVSMEMLGYLPMRVMTILSELVEMNPQQREEAITSLVLSSPRLGTNSNIGMIQANAMATLWHDMIDSAEHGQAELFAQTAISRKISSRWMAETGMMTGVHTKPEIMQHYRLSLSDLMQLQGRAVGSVSPQQLPLRVDVAYHLGLVDEKEFRTRHDKNQLYLTWGDVRSFAKKRKPKDIYSPWKRLKDEANRMDERQTNPLVHPDEEPFTVQQMMPVLEALAERDGRPINQQYQALYDAWKLNYGELTALISATDNEQQAWLGDLQTALNFTDNKQPKHRLGFESDAWRTILSQRSVMLGDLLLMRETDPDDYHMPLTQLSGDILNGYDDIAAYHRQRFNQAAQKAKVSEGSMPVEKIIAERVATGALSMERLLALSVYTGVLVKDPDNGHFLSPHQSIRIEPVWRDDGEGLDMRRTTIDIRLEEEENDAYQVAFHARKHKGDEDDWRSITLSVPKQLNVQREYDDEREHTYLSIPLDEFLYVTNASLIANAGLQDAVQQSIQGMAGPSSDEKYYRALEALLFPAVWRNASLFLERGLGVLAASDAQICEFLRLPPDEQRVREGFFDRDRMAEETVDRAYEELTDMVAAFSRRHAQRREKEGPPVHNPLTLHYAINHVIGGRNLGEMDTLFAAATQAHRERAVRQQGRQSREPAAPAYVANSDFMTMQAIWNRKAPLAMFLSQPDFVRELRILTTQLAELPPGALQQVPPGNMKALVDETVWLAQRHLTTQERDDYPVLERMSQYKTQKLAVRNFQQHQTTDKTGSFWDWKVALTARDEMELREPVHEER